jgi:transposase InsO family protein
MKKAKKAAPQKPQKGKPATARRHCQAYPTAIKLRIVREVLDRGVSTERAAQLFGISKSAIMGWVRRFELGGAEALEPGPVGQRPRQPSAANLELKQAVEALRREHPDYGTRRIRDVLARFEALGVSETDVRRIVHEAGLMADAPPSHATKEHPPRSFERAEPNQLWQSDIFTFLLRKHERVYVAAFLDDHSRFIVGYSLAYHQRSSLVLEAMSRAIADYGAPREVLTDQGRQYTAWRGQTEFEGELRQHGIRHVKSRPQHPQTLGKIERFWKTLWDEFLSRTVFSDYADCIRRFALYVHAYNFQRPHQALGGLVPADRFFRAAPHVRVAMEQGIADNAMRLAREQPTRKPFYLVGRLGDTDLSIAAAGEGIRVQVGEQEPRTISLPREDICHEQNTESQADLDPEDESTGWLPAAPSPTGAQVDSDPDRPGRDGAAPMPAAAFGSQWGKGGVRCDRGGEDLTAVVLPAGESSAASHADGAHAPADADGQRAGHGLGAYRAAGGPGPATGERETPGRALAAADAQRNEDGPDEHCETRSEEAHVARLDPRWQQAFRCLQEIEESSRAAAEASAGWRGRALKWDRKLAGSDSELYQRPAEVCDEQRQEQDLHADARGAGRTAAALPGRVAGALGSDRREPGGAAAWNVPQPLPDDHAPWPAGDDDWDEPQAAGSSGQSAGTLGAAARERAASQGQRQTPISGGAIRPTVGDRSSRVELPGEGPASAATEPLSTAPTLGPGERGR